MSDKVEVTNWPAASTKEQVALELQRRIALSEKDIAKDRTYWLKLYYECLYVTGGGNPKNLT